jgi:hypothetical protein
MIRNYIMSLKSVTLIFADNSVRPIPVENPLYNQLKQLLEAHDYEGATAMADRAAQIRQHSKGEFFVTDGIVYLKNGDALPDALSKRVVQFADEGIDFAPLIAFWDNIKKNPSLDSVTDLYAFLEHNNIPITVDGCFICYKRVGEGYLDLHSGRFDNSIGKVVKCKREDVDPDRNVTCSRGLHVAAYNYAYSFYGNGHLLEVKVNPANVVAVPTDYNNEKMRVCEYEVVRECAGPRDETIYTDDSSYEADNFEDDIEDDNFEDDTSVETDVEDKVDSLVGIKASPDSNGRLIIPTTVVRNGLHAKSGQKINVQISKDKILLGVTGNEANKVYTVDNSCNLRVGRCFRHSWKVVSVVAGVVTLTK